MLQDLRERGRWLARNVLPHEALIRARLSDVYVPDLDIEDIIQEMYARILSVPSLEAIRYPRQYAIQTAKSIVVDHMRHARVISIASSGSLEQLNIAFPEASTEERLEFQGEIQEIASALAQLPVACRETLILRRIEGLSQKETAQRLRVSEKAVEKYMSKGVCMLAELFGRGGKCRVRASSISGENIRSKDESFKQGD
jgi:RNA polymerase sigma factor (sigma-70 family)